MSWLSAFLRKRGFLPPYSDDERLDAESDNIVHDLNTSKDVLAASQNKNTQTSATLRETMKRSRNRVANFAQFEERIRNMHYHREAGK